YSGNPVLKNPGIKDFRDPKVMWYEAGHKWVMTLATHDRVSFYSSRDLKQWTKETEFGKNEGGHGGVWECPDLFPLALNGKTYWVLLVNINPGGPNKGSVTQYFIGRFNGHRFMPVSTQEHWVDYGPDNYAGVTWSNTGNRRIFLGWMSNWLYAINSPTEKWRNAMTIPRELGLKQEGDQILLTSEPVKELNVISNQIYAVDHLTVNKPIKISDKSRSTAKQYLLKFSGRQLTDFSLTLSDPAGQKLIIGYDSHADQYFIDRSTSGNVNFNKEFASKHTAPRLTKDKAFDITLIVDASSAELFADGGLSNMTSIFFSSQPMNTLGVQSSKGIIVDKVRISTLKSIW
ncbi:MAG: glycoside hydrolase family 32 protein, partial [Janthinobacterium lividum]